MVLQSGNGEAEGRWLLRMQEYKPGYRGGRQSLGTMKQVEEQESVRVEQEDLRTWDQEAQVPWSLGPSSLQDSYSEAKGLGKGLTFPLPLGPAQGGFISTGQSQIWLVVIGHIFVGV